MIECCEEPRILVATPDELLRGDYASELQNDGFDVTGAATGVECVERLRSHTAELVVLDTDLLWGGAEGVVAWLVEERLLPPTKVLLLTPRFNRSILYALGRFSISDYQTKPLTGRGLAQRVRSLLTAARHPGRERIAPSGRRAGKSGWP